jgi:hypothetical protein
VILTYCHEMARATECYLVNDRPVLIVGTAEGGADCLVLDWASGSFVPDRSYFSRTIPGDFADVDSVTLDQMSSIVAAHRARILHRLAGRLAAESAAPAARADDDTDVIQLLGLTPGTPPFDADDAESTIGPGLMVLAPRMLRRHHLDAVFGAPQLGAGPDDTVAASYHVTDTDGAGACTVLAVFPSTSPDSDAVLVQLART